MKYDKIMAGGNLDNIMGRLICCNALLDALRLAMDDADPMVDALAGVHDLLEVICRDFQADIDSAEDYIETEDKA